MLHFDSSKCDAIVLEVGLGGRLDSTNVCSPSVTAITSIGLDHQHVLGETLTEIAAEKSGIIKPNVPVVSGVIDDDAADVVSSFALKQDSRLYQIGRDFDFQCSPADDWGSKLIFQGDSSPLSENLEVSLQMEGEHQARNAAIAIAISDLLRDQGLSIGTTALRQGLDQLTCIGRIERFSLPHDVIGIVQRSSQSGLDQCALRHASPSCCQSVHCCCLWNECRQRCRSDVENDHRSDRPNRANQILGQS